MKRYALACPGQGIIPLGCLAPFSKFRPSISCQLDQIDEALGEKFSNHLFNTDLTFNSHWLSDTANAQPAILASTFLSLEVFRRQHNIDLASSASYILGHSLGEFTALTLAGILDLSCAVKTVRKRANLMKEVVLKYPATYVMYALLVKPQNWQSVVDLARSESILANINSTLQVVISGTEAQISEFRSSSSKLIMRAVKLPVSIPFHNQILTSIEPELREFLMSQTLAEPKVPIISNYSGSVSSTKNEILSNTVSATSAPVQWVESLKTLNDQDVSVISLGPGSVMHSLNKKAVSSILLQTPDDFPSIISGIKLP
jgi:(acyl-carrier-protein) S-malonyltransferase